MKITLSTRNRTNATVKHIRVFDRAPTRAEAIRIVDEDRSTFEFSIMQSEDNLSYYAEIHGLYNTPEQEQERLRAHDRFRLEEACRNARRCLLDEIVEFQCDEHLYSDFNFSKYIGDIYTRLDQFINLCKEDIDDLDDIANPEELEQERLAFIAVNVKFWSEAQERLAEVKKVRTESRKANEEHETTLMQSEDKE